MTSSVKHVYTLVRTVDVSGGLIPDPDWVATQDHASWEPHCRMIRPSHSGGQGGYLEMAFVLYDDPTTPVAVTNAARLTVELVQILEPRAAGIPDTLGAYVEDIVVIGAEGWRAEVPRPFDACVAARLVSSTGLPTANNLALLARIS